MPCSVEGCVRPLSGRRFCRSHYRRWNRFGSPEPRHADSGALPRFVYDVALKHTSDECLMWPFYLDGANSARMRIGGKPRSVCRFICEATQGPPPTPKHEAAHSCGKGVKGCVSPRHLRWATHVENEADKLIHGTSLRGSRSGTAKLTAEAVHQIRALKGILPQAEIGKRFGVSQENVSCIISGRRWSWLPRLEENVS